MKEFMYIFRGAIANEQAFAKLSPEDMQKEMQKWNAWMGKLASTGQLIGRAGFHHGQFNRSTFHHQTY